MQKHLLIAALMALSNVALAAGGGDGHIPTDIIFKQIFNLTIVVIILTFALKSAVKGYFTQRKANFEQAAVLAKKAKEDAERHKKDLSARLDKLQTGATQSKLQAEKEAEELKQKIRFEAEALAKQIREEAQATAKQEIEKAKSELRAEVLNQAMTKSREMMKATVKESDQKRLQNEFVDKIQVVRG